jgi:hypothetical protein
MSVLGWRSFQEHRRGEAQCRLEVAIDRGR